MALRKYGLRRVKIGNRPTAKGIRVEENWWMSTSSSALYTGWFFGYSTDGSGDDYVYVLARPTSSPYQVDFVIGEIIDDVDTELTTFSIDRNANTFNNDITITAGAGSISVTLNAGSGSSTTTNTLDCSTTDSGWLMGATNVPSTGWYCGQSLWSDYDPYTLQASLTAEASIPYARPANITFEGAAALSAAASVAAAGDYDFDRFTVKSYRWYKNENKFMTGNYTPAAALNTPLYGEEDTPYILRLLLKNESGRSIPRPSFHLGIYKGSATSADQAFSTGLNNRSQWRSVINSNSTVNYTDLSGVISLGNTSYLNPAGLSRITLASYCNWNNLGKVKRNTNIEVHLRFDTEVYSNAGYGSPKICRKEAGECFLVHCRQSTSYHLHVLHSSSDGSSFGSASSIYAHGSTGAVQCDSYEVQKDPSNGRWYVYYCNSATAQARIYYAYTDDEGATWASPGTPYISVTSNVTIINEVVFHPSNGDCAIRFNHTKFIMYNGTSWNSEQTATNPTSITNPDIFMAITDSHYLHLFRHQVADSSDGDEETEDDNYVLRHYRFLYGGIQTYRGGTEVIPRAKNSTSFNETRGSAACIDNDGTDLTIAVVAPQPHYGSKEGGFFVFAYDISADTMEERIYQPVSTNTYFHVGSSWWSHGGPLRYTIDTVGFFCITGEYDLTNRGMVTHIWSNLGAMASGGDTLNGVLLSTQPAGYRSDFSHTSALGYNGISEILPTQDTDPSTLPAIANNDEFELEVYMRTPQYPYSWKPYPTPYEVDARNIYGDTNKIYRYYDHPPDYNGDLTGDNYIDANGAVPPTWNNPPASETDGFTVVAGTHSAYELQSVNTGSGSAGISFPFPAGYTSDTDIVVNLIYRPSVATLMYVEIWNETDARMGTRDILDTTHEFPLNAYQGSGGSVSGQTGDEIMIRLVNTDQVTMLIDRIMIRVGGTSLQIQDASVVQERRGMGPFLFDNTPLLYSARSALSMTGVATIAAAGSLDVVLEEGAASVTGVASVTVVGDYAGGTVTGNVVLSAAATVTPVATTGITKTIAAVIEAEAICFSVGAVYRTQQIAYRWRNDDGTETTATWAAPTNATISPQYNQIYRLRLGIYAVSTTEIPPSNLEYRVNGLGDWKPVGGYQTAMQVPEERWIEEATYVVDLNDFATDGIDLAGYQGNRFFVSNNGRWHIFFHAIAAGDTYATLHHVYSDNDGTSWSTPTSIPCPEWDDTGTTFGDGIVKNRLWGEIEVQQQPNGSLVLVEAAHGSEFVPNVGTYYFRHTHWTKSVNNGVSWADSQIIDGANGGVTYGKDIHLEVLGNDEWMLSTVTGGTAVYQRYRLCTYYNGTNWYYSGSMDIQPAGYDEMQHVASTTFIDGSGDLIALHVAHDTPFTSGGFDEDDVYPMAVVTIKWPAADWDDPTTPSGLNLEAPVVEEVLHPVSSPLGNTSAYCMGYMIRNSSCTAEPFACSFFTPRQEDYVVGAQTADWMYGFYGKNGWETSELFSSGMVWVEEADHTWASYFDNQYTTTRVTLGEDEHALVKTNISWYETFTPAVDLENMVQVGLTKGLFPPTEVHTYGRANLIQEDFEWSFNYNVGVAWMDITPTIHWEQADSKYYRVRYDETVGAEELILQSLDTASGCYLRGTNNFDPTTQQITSGTYQSSNKGMAMWGVAECRWHTIPANTYVEYEYYVKTAADGFGASDGDYVELRVYGIDDYVELPTITYVREKAALTGVATVTANGDTDGPKSAVSAVATLSAVGRVQLEGVTALQGAATLASLSKMDRFAACVAAGEAILAPTGDAGRGAKASLSAFATLESDALSVVKGAWAVSAAASVSGIPTTEVACRASLSGIASASGNASADRPASAHLRGYALLGLRSDLCLLPGHRVVFRPSNEIIHWEYSGLETAYHPGEGQGHGGHPGQGEEHHTGGDPSDWGRVVPHEIPSVIIEKAGVPEVVVYKQPTDEVTV